MPRGGKRSGSGRKTGTKLNTARAALIRKTQEIAAEASVTPLAYMLQVLKDPARPEKERFQAAIAAAPYVHPRLSNATVTTTVKRSVDELTTAELIAALQQDADRDGAATPEAGDRESDQVH